jgi:hypothetical protein
MTNLTLVLRGLLLFNLVLHLISAAFAGAWVADMLAPYGDLTSIDWLKLVLSVVALALGLTGSSYIALKYITALPEPIQRRSKIAFIVTYVVVALVLAAASASVIAKSAGDRAHMERMLDNYREAIEARRAAAAQILSRTTALNDCVTVAQAMRDEEAGSGAFSQDGRNVGRVAITLQNISTGCAAALRSVYESRHAISRHIDRAERLLTEIRQTIDGDEIETRKMIIVHKKMDDLARVLRAMNDAFPIEAMNEAAAATSKDWFSIGLPESAAVALTGNFAGLGERVTEGLDDIESLKARKLPQMRVVPAVAYLGLYPQATAGALVLGLIIELLPLVTILIGFAMAGNVNGLRNDNNGRDEDHGGDDSGIDLARPKRGRPRKGARDANNNVAANQNNKGRRGKAA